MERTGLPRSNARDGNAENAAPEHFFLPDFCGQRAFGVLVLVAELLAVVLVLARGGLLSLDAWIDLALTSLFVQLVALSAAALLCRLRMPLSRLPRALAAVLAYGVIVVDTLLFSLLAQYLYGSLLYVTAPSAGPTLANVISHVLIAAIIGGLVMRYFYVQEQLRLQQEAELKARIQALQSRIRPHFLFNSMNIIASLIAVDPVTAETVVEDLSDLFRASLRDAGNEVPLAQELELCRRYERIEQLRLGRRLRVDWQLAEGLPLHDLRIPLLTLQPLLENAIYHGIQPLAEGGVVTIRITWEGSVVRIQIDNPVPPVAAASTEPSHKGNRMALDNIRYRLRALYGPSADLEGGRLGATYGTTLHYPFNIDRQGLTSGQKLEEQQAGTRP